MENLRIMALNKQQKDEIVDLLIQCGGIPNLVNRFDLMGIHVYANGTIQDVLDEDYEVENHKEITLPQLRDLVVLKRNDVGDKTHYCDSTNSDYFLSSENAVYFFDDEKTNSWKISNYDLSELKPIGAVIKEYLDPENDYKFIVTDKPFFDWIEIPNGCNIITCQDRMGIPVYFHWKYLGSDEFFLKDEKIWSNNFGEALSDFIEKNEGDVVIVWQRHNQPEELPFIDDEPSLNDQYAEIEKVREKHSHYKKDISHLDILDVYRVTELFKPHSCGAHIAKKALCSGQRGHKDLLTDIQDIIDTAERWKQMLIEDENSGED